MHQPNSKQPSFKELNAYFDAVYVLTLHRSTERRNRFREQCKGLKFSFFFGIDKQTLDIDRVEEQGHYSSHLHRNTKRTTRDMSLGEIACALSHRAIYERIVAKGHKRTLILEDDAMPNTDALANFGALVQKLPHAWDMLMLGYYAEKPNNLYHLLQKSMYRLYRRLGLFRWQTVSKAWIDGLCQKPYNDMLWNLSKCTGGHAYALSDRAARQMIAYQHPVRLQADRIFYELQANSDLKGYMCKQRLFGLNELSKISYIGYESARGFEALRSSYLKNIVKKSSSKLRRSPEASLGMKELQKD